ncbi:MAG: ABC transporter ATP-binding protein [Saprospiraceae bacterium]|jgi:ABC-type multidrug transport system ATPase subunit|nr:ABC transporter ATP-binding protein [Saprospiraceae bacterium]MBV6473074.1 putative ABC transporter ATP-binding protein YxlF [Saprospiraceae bacterium]
MASLQIIAHQLGKRYRHSWIFRDFSHEFRAPEVYGISGPNGSGKSTLLQVLTGFVPPTRGKLKCEDSHAPGIPVELHPRLAYAAPYAEVYEYLTLRELLGLHLRFRPLYRGLTGEDFLRIAYLEGHEEKLVKTFSSGMKQRLKLALAILTQSEALVLDEPVTNLDSTAKEWYRELIREFNMDRLILIASNETSDFEGAGTLIHLPDFAPRLTL